MLPIFPRCQLFRMIWSRYIPLQCATKRDQRFALAFAPLLTPCALSLSRVAYPAPKGDGRVSPTRDGDDRWLVLRTSRDSFGWVVTAGRHDLTTTASGAPVGSPSWKHAASNSCGSWFKSGARNHLPNKQVTRLPLRGNGLSHSLPDKTFGAPTGDPRS